MLPQAVKTDLLCTPPQIFLLQGKYLEVLEPASNVLRLKPTNNKHPLIYTKF